MIRFLLNERDVSVDAGPGRPLLDVLRRDFRLTSVKEGCREGDCGSCLVLIGEGEGGDVRYRPVNSCLTPVGDAEGRHVVTVEGLNRPELSPLQAALLEQGAVQCGFCTPGIVVAVTAYLIDAPRLDPREAALSAAGNICRCTGYVSIVRALESLCARLPAGEFSRAARGGARGKIEHLVRLRLLPDYFTGVPAALASLPAAPARPSFPVDRTPVVAGGTDLYVERGEEIGESRDPLLISGRRDLSVLGREGGVWRIGAAVTLEDLGRCGELGRELPEIGEWLALVAAPAVRARATVSGNIVHASPVGDAAVLLLALGGSVELRSERGRREVALEDFFLGYKRVDLLPGEIVAEVRFPAPAPDARLSFEKVSRRVRLDIAAVNSAALIEAPNGTIRRARFSAGGVAPVPMLLRGTSSEAAGKALTARTASEAGESAEREASPISDVRGSASYKRRLLRHVIGAHFLKLFPEGMEGYEP